MTDDSQQNPFGAIPIAGSDQKDNPPEDTAAPAAESAGLPAPVPASPPPQEARAGSHPRQLPEPRRRAGLVWLLGLPMAGFACYLLAGYLLMPYLLRHVLPAHLARTLERPVTVGAADFNPLTLTLTLHNTIIGPRLTDPDDDVDPLLSFGRLKLDLAAASLLRLGLVCRKVELEKFFLHVVRRENAVYNVQELLPARADGKFSSPLGRLRFSLNNIVVSDSRLLFDDRPAGRMHRLEEISLALPVLANIAFRSDQYLNPRFSAKINGSPLNLTGETRVTPEALTARLSLRLKQLDLPSYFAYLPVKTNFTPGKGLADLNLDLVIQTDAAEDAKLQIEGTGRLVDVWLQTMAEGKGLARLPVVTGAISFAPLSGRYRLKELSLQQPEFLIDRAPDGRWLLPRFAAASGVVEIERVHITGGRLSLVDRRVRGGFADTWSEIQLSLEGLTSGGKPAAFAVSGRNREQARLSAQGHLTADPLRVEGVIVGHQLQLAAWSPYLEKAQLRLQAGEIVKLETSFTAGGRQGNIDFSCSGLAARIDGLTLVRQDEKWLHLPQLVIGGTSIHWPDRRLEVGTLQAVGGSLLLSWDQDGLFNWSTAAGGTGPDEWQVAVEAAEASGTAVTFRTLALPAPLTLDFQDAVISLADLATNGPEKGRLKASARLFGTSQVEVAGHLGLRPFAGSLACRTGDLPLKPLQPLFSGWFRPAIEAGVLEIDGELNLQGPVFQGGAKISQFAAVLEQEEVIRWQQAKSENLNLDLAAGTLQADSIYFQRPFVSWTAPAQQGSSLGASWNLSWTAGNQTPRLAIGELRLEAGALAFTDHAASPPYSTMITEISGTIAPLVSTGNRPSHIDLTGGSPGQASFVLGGALEPFAGEATADLKLGIRQFAVAPLSIYLTDLLGYRLTGGTIDLTAAITLRRQRLQATNRLGVTGLQLGEQLDRASRLPLALALHTTTRGELELSLPVSGHTGTADFSYREELRRGLRHLLLKTAVSPQAFLTPLVPAGALPEYLTFAPGQADLSQEDKKQLQHLAEILARRPLLRIVLHGYADADYDRPALEKRQTALKVTRRTEEITWPQQASASPGREETAPGAGDPVETGDLLQELAFSRSDAIRRYLTAVHGLPAGRITIGPVREPVPPGAPGRRGNRVDIELKAMRP